MVGVALLLGVGGGCGGRVEWLVRVSGWWCVLGDGGITFSFLHLYVVVNAPEVGRPVYFGEGDPALMPLRSGGPIIFGEGDPEKRRVLVVVVGGGARCRSCW